VVPGPSAALGARRLFLTECRFFPEFVQDALRESYKYGRASCAARRGGSCFPSGGRGSGVLGVQAAAPVGVWGEGLCCARPPLPAAGTGCCHPARVAEPSPVAPRQTGLSKKQHVGKSWWAFWGTRQQEEGEVLQRLVLGTKSKALLGTVPAPF